MKKIKLTAFFVFLFFGCFAQCSHFSIYGGECYFSASSLFGTITSISGSWITASVNPAYITLHIASNGSTNPRNGSITYTVKDGTGYKSATTSFTQDGVTPPSPPPTPPPPPPVCSTFTITGPTALQWTSGNVPYTFTCTGYGGGVTYTWWITGGPVTSISQSGNSLTVVADIAVAVQPIVVYVTSNNGCGGSHNVQVFP